ncbi:APG_G0017830.mRNA.1.CDS.1 [Saccharomyces cerevisiae]|nr:Irc5p [Saccharomyces cerevisiae YJM244]AJU37003.1 Irc5p [Saccharomyces cerevisiae YJM554]AJU37319.1 Irc5p [Saccharomyces cerevisiae YJM681]AJU37527.1 Irc5p [Saccharomyces cerevisiae YJM683]AJU38843.1 Irc5p [Saccharomyces cerevisiae YJM1129]AJV22276.1 Irc5p [Saccharomyces cerevisiae YJM1336]AJV22793.1 Irc5p [Saccharomyces cerevisiae YJM1356]KAJ1546712.1 putative ATPase [Saccharomyces cerevisiae]
MSRCSNAALMTVVEDAVGARVAARTRNMSNGVNYREKEVNDLTADISDSDSDLDSEDNKHGKGDNDTAPIWLQDDVHSDEDIQLDSEDDSDTEAVQAQVVDKLAKDTKSEQKSLDDELSEMDTKTVSLKLKKLNEFVRQSQVYSSIIADTLLQRSNEVANANTKDNSNSNDEEHSSKKRKTKKKSITDFFRKQKKNEDTTTQNGAPDDAAIKQPRLLKNCILKPYQLEGLNWLITLYENGLNGILADEMGLGKTVQSIALLAFIYEMDTKGPFLVTAPLSTLDNWMNEFAKFAPDLPVLKYYGTNGYKERSAKLKNFFKQHGGTGIVITSYEIILRDTDLIMSQNWKFLIVDEGHRLKNINCRLIKELKKINTSNRLLLTGTPLQNNLAELWSLLNFIMPDIFADFEIFNKWFDFDSLNLGSGSNSEALNKLINDELQKNLISNLHTILKPFLLRRLKKVVLANILPPKREYIINCPMTSAQEKFYKAGLNGKLKKTMFKELIKDFFILNDEYIGHVSNRSIRDFINYKLSGNETSNTDNRINPTLLQMDKLYKKNLQMEISNKKLQNMMMQLRQIIDSTFLFYFPYLHPEDLTLETLLKTSGKLQILQKLIPPLISEGHKVLIYSQFVNMLDLIEDWCDLNSFATFRIDGSVNNETRKDQLEKFNSSKDKHNIFLLSTRAAGLGINLVGADTVVLFDSDWNPQVDLQAMDRCHRIGQESPVIVYRLCCDNTIEHVILTRAANKRNLERMVIQMGKFNNLKKLALNEGSFLKANKAGVNVTNKDLVQELSMLLMSDESSIGFENGGQKENKATEGQLTDKEVEELTNRSLEAYKANRVVDLPHVKLFETTSGL